MNATRSRIQSQQKILREDQKPYRVQTADHIADEIKDVEDGAINYE